MDADIDLVGEQLANAFAADLAESGLNLDVTYVYEIEENLGTFTGRKVQILPLAYTPVAPVSRRDDNLFDVSFSIVVIERYNLTPKPPQVPKAWIKERTLWIQEKIFNPLCNTENPLMLEIAYDPSAGDLARYWSQAVAVTEVCSIQFLREDKTFWSELECTFRRIK